MTATAITTDIWTERRRRVAELRARHGFARQLLDFYGALLGVQEKAHGDAATASPPAASVAAFALVTASAGIRPSRC